MDSFAYGPRKRRRSWRSRVLGAVFGFLLAGGIAFAAWQVIVDNAPGYTNAGTLVAPTVSAGGTFSGDPCYPGSTCDAVFNVSNPNSALVISATAVPSNLGSPTGCSVHLSANPQTGLSVPVPAGVTNNIVVPDAFQLSAAAPSSCQGAALFGNVKLTFSTP